MPTLDRFTVLPATIWQARSTAHRKQAEAHTLPARYRSDRGQPHPIADFLFEYYPFSFAFLEHWHPGLGMALEWNPPTPHVPYAGRGYTLENGLLHVNPASLTAKEHLRLSWIAELLEATHDRAPNFACHGLHEWAMVYQGRDVRHEKTLELRLSQPEIDSIVKSRALCCTHHDAFRFFAKNARPLNHLQPTLETRISLEQPGCIHANMDLYKWTAKAMPWAGSELLLECFELAMDLRELDMRASPYDLTNFGHPPIRIETADGRREYEDRQKTLAARAIPLREQLIRVIRQTLAQARA